ncbi:MAG TPA: DMT family transporter [Puia sp.]|nr:DMT family transporter [Puia sp.]
MKWQGFLISFTGAILFSTKAILVKLAFHHTHTDGLTLLMLRMLLSLPFYLLTALWTSRRARNIRMKPGQWGWVILLGLLGYYVSSLFDFIGLQYISAGLERLILFLYPSFAVLINAMLFRQRISRAQVVALVLSYTGIGIAYFGELKIDTGNPHFFWGSFLVFICSITYAFYLSGTGKMVPLLGAAKFTTFSMLTATLGVLTHYFIRQAVSGHAAVPTGPGTGALWTYGIALALVATVIPSYMLSAGMKRIGANNAAIVTSVGPVSTIVQAHYFLDEPIFMEQVIGTVMVIMGVLLIGWRGAKAVGETPEAQEVAVEGA